MFCGIGTPVQALLYFPTEKGEEPVTNTTLTAKLGLCRRKNKGLSGIIILKFILCSQLVNRILCRYLHPSFFLKIDKAFMVYQFRRIRTNAGTVSRPAAS
jgi:hypothetical protein